VAFWTTQVRAGLPFTEQWHRYLAFDVATSLGWDTGRAVTNFVTILIAGPAALTTFRRAARRANFTAPVRFSPRTADGPNHRNEPLS
jgi:energy-coupling factor transport system substrate-specific component